MSDEIAGFEKEADEYDAAHTALDAELDLEAPEADAADQRIELLRHREEPITERPAEPVDEADPADVAEQRRVVDTGDDEYR